MYALPICPVRAKVRATDAISNRLCVLYKPVPKRTPRRRISASAKQSDAIRNPLRPNMRTTVRNPNCTAHSSALQYGAIRRRDDPPDAAVIIGENVNVKQKGTYHRIGRTDRVGLRAHACEGRLER